MALRSVSWPHLGAVLMVTLVAALAASWAPPGWSDGSRVLHSLGVPAAPPARQAQAPRGTLQPDASASYTVYFNETGLSSSDAWYINVTVPANISATGTLGLNATGATTSLTAALPNGTYEFTVATDDHRYAPNYYSDRVTVSAARTAAPPVAFREFTYDVTFSETGLSAGTGWSVNLSGKVQKTSGTSDVLDEVNGSYRYNVTAIIGYESNPTNGLVVVDGAAASVAIRFTPLYPVSFEESGLPTNTSWSIVFQGSSQTSTHAWNNFTERNGTYAFMVPSVGNWTALPPGGNVTLAGASVTEGIVFMLTYPLTFLVPNGTSTGTSWMVSLVGVNVVAAAVLPSATVSQTSVGTAITFEEPNGTYSYLVTVSSDPTYRASGTVSVVGDSATVTPPGISTSSSEGSGGGVGGTLIYPIVGAVVIVAVLVVVVAVIVSLVSSRRKQSHPPPEVEPLPDPPNDPQPAKSK